MRILLGVLLVLAAVVFGVWVGLFVFFIGGIEQIVDQINAEEADGGTVAWGIIKIFLAGGVGMISFLIASVPGMALITSDRRW